MVILPPLRRKVLRDLRRLWAQALAIALVLAAGVATLILGVGTGDSLAVTRARYYEENRFADIFASLTRAPSGLLAEIAAIDDVLAAEGRIRAIALLDIDDMAEPGSVALVSLPPSGKGGLNRLHLREGRLPDPQADDEAVVSEAFAAAHRLHPGARFAVLMKGGRRELTVAGVGLSPEFIYALGPGEIMPDPRRFGIVWMPPAALEAAYDLDGAFNDLVVKLAPGGSETRVIAAIDRILRPYGGVGAVGRGQQLSHAFLDAELRQLRVMSEILPPIFLLVSALLVNMTLARLVALEREQIGLLKALGYGSGAIARHYLEFVGLVALAGLAIGWLAGTWLGVELAQLYVRFFAFPYLVFVRAPWVYGLSALVTLGAGLGGALAGVRGVLRLTPAVAMSPPAPPDYSRRLTPAPGRALPFSRRLRMALRHLGHRPLRTAAAVLGVALAVTVLTGSLWTRGSIEHVVEISFHRAGLQDATIAFAGPEPARAALAAARMPGVLAAEPFRSVAAEIGRGSLHRRIALTGKPAAPGLSRTLDTGLRPIMLPDDGLILSEALARLLQARPGDQVTVDLLEGRRRSVTLPVRGLSTGYFGLSAEIEIGALNRLMDEGAAISGVHVRLDPAAQADFHAAAKAMPKTAFVTLKATTQRRFAETMSENMTIMTTVYVTLAAIIAFGVVYNAARISLSEQGRDLASLRVLGFSPAEVAAILFGELAAIVLAAQPLGWLLGYALARGMVASLSSDLYQVPLVIGREVYATASVVVLAAALVSALAMWGRIRALDMIAVLKTRE